MARKTCGGRDGDDLACSGRTGYRDEDELHAHSNVRLVSRREERSRGTKCKVCVWHLSNKSSLCLIKFLKYSVKVVHDFILVNFLH